MDHSDARRRANWVEILVVVALIGLFVWSARRPSRSLIESGMLLPEMMAQGWLNTDHPLSRDNLIGKIVVVDCWATWCPPCRAAMPKLARLAAKYRPLGVEFVGLTPETEADQNVLEGFVASVPGFDWPVGYGAAPTLDALGIEVFPTVIVFSPQGTAIWSSSFLDGLPEALDEALAVGRREL